MGVPQNFVSPKIVSFLNCLLKSSGLSVKGGSQLKDDWIRCKDGLGDDKVKSRPTGFAFKD